MLVKIEFIEHNRKYKIGIQKFLKAAGISMTDAELERAVVKILNQQEANLDEPNP